MKPAAAASRGGELATHPLDLRLDCRFPQRLGDRRSTASARPGPALRQERQARAGLTPEPDSPIMDGGKPILDSTSGSTRTTEVPERRPDYVAACGTPWTGAGGRELRAGPLIGSRGLRPRRGDRAPGARRASCARAARDVPRESPGCRRATGRARSGRYGGDRAPGHGWRGALASVSAAPRAAAARALELRARRATGRPAGSGGNPLDRDREARARPERLSRRAT